MSKRERHRNRLFVEFTFRIMMQVMKFPDSRVPGLQHLHVQEPGDAGQILRGETISQAIHKIAPGPETVIAVPRHFGAAGERALKRMAVHIAKPRHQHADTLVGYRLAAGFDVGNRAVGRKANPHILAPALR